MRAAGLIRAISLACPIVSGIGEVFAVKRGTVTLMRVVPRKWILTAAMLLVLPLSLAAQEPPITPPESIAAEKGPKIAASMADTADRYGGYRGAGLAGWK